MVANLERRRPGGAGRVRTRSTGSRRPSGQAHRELIGRRWGQAADGDGTGPADGPGIPNERPGRPTPTAQIGHRAGLDGHGLIADLERHGGRGQGPPGHLHGGVLDREDRDQRMGHPFSLPYDRTLRRPAGARPSNVGRSGDRHPSKSQPQLDSSPASEEPTR